MNNNTSSNPSQERSSEERSYIAFISYRHLPVDKQAAELVQKKIENYTIPKELREKYGAKKFGHVFRDEDELPTAASLTDSIYYALDHSKFLIVICTPGLPQSQWCEAEIKYFLKTHDRDHVLAVLADGEPDESFSPYLLHEFDEDGNPISDIEPLAANIKGPNHTINKKALNKEIVRIYATFLGCPFDSLWQRERRARTNRLLSAAGVAIAILCVFLGVLINRNARIREQNIMIEAQNTELQTRMSSVLVDSGLSKLEGHDIKGALTDAVSSMESGDPAIYDHRVGMLLSDTLCAYKKNELRSSIIYEQSTSISSLALTPDKKHLLFPDSVGVIRCLDLDTHEIVWEVPTANNDMVLYTNVPGDRFIYKSTEGVFCLSLKDGSQSWALPRHDSFGNRFQAISEDGTIFAAIDQNSAAKTLDLVFINTLDGSELGRIALNDEDNFTPEISMIDNPFTYAAAFSSDNSKFVFGIPGETSEAAPESTETIDDSEAEPDGDENTGSGETTEVSSSTNTERVDRIWYVDMKTLTKEQIGTSGTRYRMFYGIEIDPSDDSVFFAAYTNAFLVTCLCTKDGEDYQFNVSTVNHSFSSAGGAMVLDDAFKVNESRFLSKDGRVYVFSDNQIYIFDRNENYVIQNYSSTGAVINAYWTDPENNAMEVILNDSYIIDYYFNYNEGMVLYGLQGEKADQSTMLKACPAGNGSIAQCGSYYNLSEDAPGRIYLIEFVSDPNAEVIHPLPDDYDNSSSYGFLLSDTSELGLLIYNGYNAATFDKHTGKIVKSVKFDNYLTKKGILILDDEHFLSGSDLYSLDGTCEKYGTPVGSGFMTSHPYYHVRLSDGQILSWDMISRYGFHRGKDSSEISMDTFETPDYCAVWLNGLPVESLCDPETAVCFLDDSEEYKPVVTGGENGLILQYGNLVEITDPETQEFTVHEEKELCFIDALSEKVIHIKNANPSSDSFKPAFAHQKHLLAAAYSDGQIYLYDADEASATTLPEKYNVDEIANICFSDDDTYFLVQSYSGRLDIYKTDSFEKEFSGLIRRFQELQQYPSLMSDSPLTAVTIPESDNLFITQYNACMVYSPIGRKMISEFTAESPVFDKRTGRVYFSVLNYNNSAYDSTDFYSYPVYDLEALEAWARKELE